MKVLFYASHTLYLKTLIPVLIEAAHRGAEVWVNKNRPTFISYSPRRFGDRPTRNTWVNPSALDHVAELIGYEKELSQIRSQIHWSYFPGRREFSSIVGTVKDLARLKSLSKQTATPYFALGYQHLPILFAGSRRLKNSLGSESCSEVFLQENPFSSLHGFRSIFSDPDIVDQGFVGFPYLDRVKRPQSPNSQYVLIFHPGGYRGVLSRPGDSKQICYQNQKEFLKKMGLPAFEAGLVPIIKTHPLYAKHHSLQDLEQIKSELVQEDRCFQKLELTDGSYWPIAFKSHSIITFGSSSIYELYAVGLRNVFIADFFGQDRSSYFKIFESALLSSPEDYARILNERSEYDRRVQKPDSLTDKIFNAYSGLHDQSATKRIVDEVLG